MINGAIKEVYLNGKISVIGQMFGLKMDQRYQRKGIGYMLCKQMEEEMASIGATSLYVKIESFNTDAHKLYMRRLNFNEISLQKIKLINPKSTGKHLRQINIETSFKLTKEYYADKDMTLVDVWSIFKSPFYLSTYVVESQTQDIAGISLWYASGLSDVSLVKVLLDVDRLKRPQIYLSIICLILVVGFSYIYGAYKGLACLDLPLFYVIYLSFVA